MLNTIATLGLGALMTAFAVCAVLLNEREHRARRQARSGLRQPAEGMETVDMPAASTPAPRDGRRMPVGDFLFGALALRGDEPLPFAELASAAANSGLDVAQTLEWVASAEASGLIERVEQLAEEGAPALPAVRLTVAGLDVARNNRRTAGRTARSQS